MGWPRRAPPTAPYAAAPALHSQSKYSERTLRRSDPGQASVPPLVSSAEPVEPLAVVFHPRDEAAIATRPDRQLNGIVTTALAMLLGGGCPDVGKRTGPASGLDDGPQPCPLFKREIYRRQGLDDDCQCVTVTSCQQFR